MSTGPLVFSSALPMSIGLQAHKPGSSFRHAILSTILNVLTNPASPSVVMRFPDGSTASGILGTYGTGQPFADFVVPLSMIQGIAVIRWEQTGSGPSQNAFFEERRVILPLAF